MTLLQQKLIDANIIEPNHLADNDDESTFSIKLLRFAECCKPAPKSYNDFAYGHFTYENISFTTLMGRDRNEYHIIEVKKGEKTHGLRLNLPTRMRIRTLSKM